MPTTVPSQIREFIEEQLSQAKSDSDRWSMGGQPIQPLWFDLKSATPIRALRKLLDELPDELLQLRQNDYAQYRLCLAAIDDRLNDWSSWKKGSPPPPTLDTLKEGRFANWNPVSVIYQLLGSCPDQFPSSQTRQLTFIGDTDTRQSLQVDLDEAHRALVGGEWKSATVMAGSVVEALLLLALVAYGESAAVQEAKAMNLKVGSLDCWGLQELIGVAERLGIISFSTVAQTRLAQDFRNLIHPGRARRKGLLCDRATALSAAAAVEHVANDLGRWAVSRGGTI